MTAATPTIVQVKDDTLASNYGSSARRMVEIYVEVSPAIGYTTDLSTYVPNLSAVTNMLSNGGATGEFHLTDGNSPATFSSSPVEDFAI